MTTTTTPYLAKMDRMLAEARANEGLQGVSLFVRDGNDVTNEDIAKAFCIMEEARRAGKTKIIATFKPE